MEPEDDLYREAAALWWQVFGEPPPAQVDGSRLLEMIVTSGSPLASYQRLTSPFLRPATITGPRPQRDS